MLLGVSSMLLVCDMANTGTCRCVVGALFYLEVEVFFRIAPGGQGAFFSTAPGGSLAPEKNSFPENAPYNY